MTINDIELERFREVLLIAQEMGLSECSIGDVSFKFTPEAGPRVPIEELNPDEAIRVLEDAKRANNPVPALTDPFEPFRQLGLKIPRGNGDE